MRRSGFLSASSWWSFSVRRLCSRCFFFNSCLYWPSRSRTTDCRRRSYNTPDNGKRLLKKPHQKTVAKCDSLFNSIEKHNMHTVLFTVFDTKQVSEPMFWEKYLAISYSLAKDFRCNKSYRSFFNLKVLEPAENLRTLEYSSIYKYE